jgi:uncharacterized protein with GYD domain
MPTYIILHKWTQAGIETVKDTPQRIERARNALKSVGAELKAIYFTLGEYDVISIVEAPSDEANAIAQLTAASYGSIRTETLKAFTEAEFYKIIKGFP